MNIEDHINDFFRDKNSFQEWFKTLSEDVKKSVKLRLKEKVKKSFEERNDLIDYEGLTVEDLERLKELSYKAVKNQDYVTAAYLRDAHKNASKRLRDRLTELELKKISDSAKEDENL